MSFIVETEKGEGQDSRETERERGRECEHWGMAAVALVVNRPLHLLKLTGWSASGSIDIN